MYSRRCSFSRVLVARVPRGGDLARPVRVRAVRSPPDPCEAVMYSNLLVLRVPPDHVTAYS